MNVDISKPHLSLLVSAINDAIKYNEAFLRSETVRDVSDYEEHLLCLENLQAWIEGVYKKLEKEDPGLIAYEKIVRSARR